MHNIQQWRGIISSLIGPTHKDSRLLQWTVDLSIMFLWLVQKRLGLKISSHFQLQPFFFFWDWTFKGFDLFDILYRNSVVVNRGVFFFIYYILLSICWVSTIKRQRSFILLRIQGSLMRQITSLIMKKSTWNYSY